MMQGSRERTTRAVDPAASFRSVLMVDDRKPAESPDQVVLRVSPDGTRLYAEITAASADRPSVQCWARTYLHLLARLAGWPDEPVGSHPG